MMLIRRSYRVKRRLVLSIVLFSVAMWTLPSWLDEWRGPSPTDTTNDRWTSDIASMVDFMSTTDYPLSEAYSRDSMYRDTSDELFWRGRQTPGDVARGGGTMVDNDRPKPTQVRCSRDNHHQSITRCRAKHLYLVDGQLHVLLTDGQDGDELSSHAQQLVALLKAKRMECSVMSMEQMQQHTVQEYAIDTQYLMSVPDGQGESKESSQDMNRVLVASLVSAYARVLKFDSVIQSADIPLWPQDTGTNGVGSLVRQVLEQIQDNGVLPSLRFAKRQQANDRGATVLHIQSLLVDNEEGMDELSIEHLLEPTPTNDDMSTLSLQIEAIKFMIAQSKHPAGATEDGQKTAVLINPQGFDKHTSTALDVEALSTELASLTNNAWSIIQVDSGDTLQTIMKAVSSADVIMGVPDDQSWLLPLVTAPSTTLFIELSPQTTLFWDLAKLFNRRYVRSTVEMTITKRDASLQFNTPLFSPESVDVLAMAKLVANSLNFDATKYLLYMPWEQLNNQLIEFKSACGMATMLDRVLVLPYIGYRKEQTGASSSSVPKTIAQWDFSFSHKDFSWAPFETYFDEQYLTRYAPCRLLTNDNFQALFRAHGKRSLGSLYYNPFGKATLSQQLPEYYKDLMGYPAGSVVRLRRMYQLSEREVTEEFGRHRQPFLALGCTFWMYSFGEMPDYPPEKFTNYMKDPIYSLIAKALFGAIRGRPFTQAGVATATTTRTFETVNVLTVRSDAGVGWLAQNAIKQHLIPMIGDSNNQQRYVSLHVRRGDYWTKCRAIKDQRKRSQCFPSAHRVETSIDRMVTNLATTYGIEGANIMVYMATNADPAERQEFQQTIGPKHRLRYFEDLDVQASSLLLDPIEQALVDMLVCTLADEFYGNMYSSFSRSIIEMRQLAQSPVHVF